MFTLFKQNTLTTLHLREQKERKNPNVLGLLFQL